MTTKMAKRVGRLPNPEGNRTVKKATPKKKPTKKKALPKKRILRKPAPPKVVAQDEDSEDSSSEDSSSEEAKPAVVLVNAYECFVANKGEESSFYTTATNFQKAAQKFEAAHSKGAIKGELVRIRLMGAALA